MPFTAAEPARVRPIPKLRILNSRLVLCLCLALGTLVLYSGLTRNGFVNFDDDRYILTNPHVRGGLDGTTIAWAFKSFDEANWHPLTWLSHALDCHFFQLNPAGHHYTSLLLHVLNVMLLFLVLDRLTKSKWRSLAVAALFATHPINVESVAWIAERKTVLSMLFFLLAVAAYAWYVRKPGIGRYLLIAAAFAMGLMSKPMVTTLPFALLLLDYWPLQRMNLPSTPQRDAEASKLEGETPGPSQYSARPIWWLLLEKVPLLATSIASAIVTVMAQKAGGAVSSTIAKPLLLRLQNSAVCYAVYIAKLIWPAHLAVLYPYPRALPAGEVLASALFLVTTTGLVLKYRERRYLVVGWFWYLGTMVPMIGLVQVGNQAMADRYAYLPFIGLFVMTVWGVSEWAETVTQEHRHALWKWPLVAASLSAVVALAFITRIQVGYWHDDTRLWSHALEVTQGNFVAENNLGAILGREGRDEEAAAHFRMASMLEPGDPVSQLNLGIYAQKHGEQVQAIKRYETALLLATDSRVRAGAYANLGQIYYAQRDYVRARAHFESAMMLNDPFPLQLGLLAGKMGDWDAASRYFVQAVSAEPSDVGFLLLAHALKSGGHDENARRAYRQAQSISSDVEKAQQIADQLQAQ